MAGHVELPLTERGLEVGQRNLALILDQSSLVSVVPLARGAFRKGFFFLNLSLLSLIPEGLLMSELDMQG